MLLENSNLSPDCLAQLNNLTTRLAREETFRKEAPESTLKEICEVFELSVNNEEHEDILLESVRCFRNACASCERNQTILSDVIRKAACHVKELIPKKSKTQTEIQICSVMIQFFGNAITNHTRNQRIVWSELLPIFRELLMSDESKLSLYSSMVIYNCLSPERIASLCQTPEGIDITVALCNLLYSQKDCEWVLFILEKLFVTEEFSILPVYAHLDEEPRNCLLELLIDVSKSQDKILSPQIIKGFADEFKSKAFTILGLIKADDLDGSAPVSLLLQLELLCQATSNHEKCPELVINDTDLLKCTINLLHTLRMLGEQGDNVFTSMNKISDQGKVDPKHPVYGLKRDLIRLISNMAYRNKENQHKINEMGGIELILDHCSIDALNPYILQWGIFAIHNICENNLENQQKIRGMTLQGTSENVKQLREFGVEAEMKDGKIVVRNVKDTKNPFQKPDSKS